MQIDQINDFIRRNPKECEQVLMLFAFYLGNVEPKAVKKVMESFMQVEKPPLGLMPMHIAIQQRIGDILDAMQRYNEAGKDIPQDWIEELKMHKLNQK